MMNYKIIEVESDLRATFDILIESTDPNLDFEQDLGMMLGYYSKEGWIYTDNFILNDKLYVILTKKEESTVKGKPKEKMYSKSTKSPNDDFPYNENILQQIQENLILALDSVEGIEDMGWESYQDFSEDIVKYLNESLELLFKMFIPPGVPISEETKNFTAYYKYQQLKSNIQGAIDTIKSIASLNEVEMLASMDFSLGEEDEDNEDNEDILKEVRSSQDEALARLRDKLMNASEQIRKWGHQGEANYIHVKDAGRLLNKIIGEKKDKDDSVSEEGVKGKVGIHGCPSGDKSEDSEQEFDPDTDIEETEIEELRNALVPVVALPEIVQHYLQSNPPTKHQLDALNRTIKHCNDTKSKINDLLNSISKIVREKKKG